MTNLRKEYTKQLEALTPGSGQLWSKNKYPTIATAPRITGVRSPASSRGCSPVECSSRSNSRCKIKSLARPLSPPCGAYTSDRKRHSLYPQTDQISRLLSCNQSLQVSKYQTLTRELNESLTPSRNPDRSVDSKLKNQFQQYISQPPQDTRNLVSKPKPVRFISKNSSVNYVVKDVRSRQSRHDVASILSEIHRHIQSLPV